MAARPGERDLWWAEGSGLVTGAILATGVAALAAPAPLWRGASILALAAGLRLAVFAAWQRLHRGADGEPAPVRVAPPALAAETKVVHEPLPAVKISAGPWEREARPPAPPPAAQAAVPAPDVGRPAAAPWQRERQDDRQRDEHRDEGQKSAWVGADAASEPRLTPAMAPPSASSERLVEVWESFLKEAEGQFDAPSLRRALAVAGLQGTVLGETEGGPGRNVLAVDLAGGPGRFFLLPAPGVTIRSVDDWFAAPAAGGSRLARVQRLVHPAVASRSASGWRLEQRGVVE